jgi:hypothetical protein
MHTASTSYGVCCPLLYCWVSWPGAARLCGIEPRCLGGAQDITSRHLSRLIVSLRRLRRIPPWHQWSAAECSVPLVSGRPPARSATWWSWPAARCADRAWRRSLGRALGSTDPFAAWHGMAYALTFCFALVAIVMLDLHTGPSSGAAQFYRVGAT